MLTVHGQYNTFSTRERMFLWKWSVVGSDKFLRESHMYGMIHLTYCIAILYANVYIYK